MAETIKKKKSFSQSVGAGMKSIFAPSGRTYYVLEHKMGTTKHKAGEKQEIIVDYIELGRDPSCTVQFDGAQKTVSRKHAAIYKDGDNWKLKQLSKTNETLLNGRPVKNEWYLQSGDEIQLSPGGPKLGFIVPANNTVGSIGLNRRLSLFRQQALRPYRTAITVLSIFLILAILGSGFTIWWLDRKHAEDLLLLTGTITEQQVTIEEQKQAQELLTNNINQLTESIPAIEEAAARRAREAAIAEVENRVGNTTDTSNPTALTNCMSKVYFIRCNKIGITMDGETKYITPPEGSDRLYSGTGFLLDNGKFVTARHVAEGWMFIGEDDIRNSNPMVIANAVAALGGNTVGYFTAFASDGSSFNFKSSDFKYDRSTDRNFTLNTDDGPVPLCIAQLDNTDWAAANLNRSGGLSFDPSLSNSLQMMTHLEVLGFPLGIGFHSPSNLKPIYGNCTVAKAGFENGVILITNRNFEKGNSGGPVFAKVNGTYKVVGLVSAGAGGSIGLIVPISVIR